MSGLGIVQECESSADDLLDRIGAGDRAAWAELVERYDRVVRGVARGFRLQDADVADAIQNTWLRVAQYSAQVRSPERFVGWLRTVARRECLALLRQRRMDVIGFEDQEMVEPSAGPEDRFLEAETAAGVRRAVAQLPESRRVLLDALFSDTRQPYRDIARKVNIPVGSIGPTRARALAMLREALDRSWTVDERDVRCRTRVRASRMS